MSHSQIRNEELYQDRTVQDWHRDAFERNCWAIDLDLMGVCPRCKKALYLIESTTNPQKPLSIIARLAKDLGIPGLMILHAEGRIVHARVVDKGIRLTQQELEDGLRALRTKHIAECA